MRNTRPHFRILTIVLTGLMSYGLGFAVGTMF